MFQKRLLTCFFLSSLISVTFFSGCKKENSSSKNAAQLLMTSSWHHVRYDEDQNIDGTIDYSDSPDICKSAASYTFFSDNIVTYTPSTTVCDSSDIPDRSTWVLQNDGKSLSWFGYNYNIQTLNDSVLSIYYDSTFSNGGKYRGYLIYHH